MSNENFAIKFEEITDNTKYKMIGSLIKPVIEIAEEKLGQDMKSYSYIISFEIENIVMKMFKDKSFEILAKFDDFGVNGYVRVNIGDKKKEEIVEDHRSYIIYNKEFDVILASPRIPHIHTTIGNYYSMIFCKNEENLKKFLSFLSEEFRKSFIEDQILMLSDSSQGLIRKITKVDKQVSREEVFLENEIKEEIFNSIDAFFNDDGVFYKKFNVPYRRGVLLYGPPGNGKTTLSKSIAHTIDSPVIYWQVNEYTTSVSLGEVFDEVMTLSPALLIIEDIDSLPSSCRSTFLNKLDGTTKNEGIFIIGTTNYPEKIDPALINRAGRFDRTYEIALPSEETKYQYLIKKGLDEFASIDDIQAALKHMSKFSMAALNELFTSVALDFYYNKRVDLIKVVKELNEIGEKQIKNDWFKDDSKRIGF